MTCHGRAAVIHNPKSTGGYSRYRYLPCLGMAMLLFSANSTADVAYPVKALGNYEATQTYKGPAYFKDTNIWVYTPAFAETFGMPQAGIDPTLQGIEAAAFRIEPGRTTCGLAGKEENCKQDYRCMLDIYVDESKHPLPWATDQKADWEDNYTSLETMLTSIPWKQRDTFLPEGVITSDWGGIVHAFADPYTRKEADFYQNGDGPDYDDIAYNHAQVFGYRRQAVAGLTMVALYHGCSTRNPVKREVTYRLEDRGPGTRMGHLRKKIPNLNRYFEFDLPEPFLNRVDARIVEHRDPERRRYKELLNMQ